MEFFDWTTVPCYGKKWKNYSVAELREIAKEVGEGLGFLHNRPVISIKMREKMLPCCPPCDLLWERYKNAEKER